MVKPIHCDFRLNKRARIDLLLDKIDTNAMRVSSGVRALVALLLLLSVSAENTDQCDNNGADNCDKWTETSNNQPLNTGKVGHLVFSVSVLMKTTTLKQ